MREEQRIVKWVVPRDYQRFEVKKSLRAFVRQFTRAVLRFGLPMYILCIAFLLWLRGHVPPEENHLIVAVWGVPVGLFAIEAMVAGVGAAFLIVRELVVLTGKGVTGGFGYVPWKHVNWFRMIDVDEFPGLRALEIGYSEGGCRERTTKLAFDPSETDEQLVAGFAADALPRKLKADC